MGELCLGICTLAPKCTLMWSCKGGYCGGFLCLYEGWTLNTEHAMLLFTGTNYRDVLIIMVINFICNFVLFTTNLAFWLATNGQENFYETVTQCILYVYITSIKYVRWLYLIVCSVPNVYIEPVSPRSRSSSSPTSYKRHCCTIQRDTINTCRARPATTCDVIITTCEMWPHTYCIHCPLFTVLSLSRVSDLSLLDLVSLRIWGWVTLGSGTRDP